MGVCRDHCPRGGHGGALRDLLLALAFLAAAYWLVGRVVERAAPAVDAGMARVGVVVSVVAGAALVAGSAWWAVTAALNRRARARYAALEREAWTERAAQSTQAALTGGARELEASPVVRAEAFRVDVPARDAA